MDIATQVEAVLRNAGYDTWTSTSVSPPVVCFENAVLVGFVHVFESAHSLLSKWQERQAAVLTRYAMALRVSGDKAWNVYSILLTGDKAQDKMHAVEKLEENFALTRKIARTAIQTTVDIENALLPLTAICANPLASDAAFEDRLRSQLQNVPERAVAAFLSETSADEVARILGDEA